MREKKIYCRGRVYLRRLYVLSLRFLGIYIHRILEVDEPVYHDHPWDFVSIVLRGGYTERRITGAQIVRRRGDVCFRFAEEFHYIEEVLPETRTLVIRGPARKNWGFLSNRSSRYVRYLPWDTIVTCCGISRALSHSTFCPMCGKKSA